MSDASDVPTGYGSGSYRSAAGPVPPPPDGHFVILPSVGGNLLIKSLAVSELMMSAECPSPVEQQSQQCLDSMSAVLDKVDRHTLSRASISQDYWGT